VSADVIDFATAASVAGASAGFHEAVAAHVHRFSEAPIGARIVYHTGYLAPTGAIAVAAYDCDRRGIGLLFQRVTGKTSRGQFREFEYILVRCTRATAQALRQTALLAPSKKD